MAKKKQFLENIWSYIVKVLLWILLWQDLKRVVWTWKPNKNSSVYKLNCNFMVHKFLELKKLM